MPNIPNILDIYNIHDIAGIFDQPMVVNFLTFKMFHSWFDNICAI